MQKSLGLIETQGLCAGIVAADAAVKSANIQLIGYEFAKGSGWTVIKVEGDVGAVKAAVDAASVAAGKVGRVVSTRVIARPSDGLHCMIHSAETVGDSASTDPQDPQGPDDSTPPDTPPSDPEPEGEQESEPEPPQSHDQGSEEAVPQELVPQAQPEEEPEASQANPEPEQEGEEAEDGSPEEATRQEAAPPQNAAPRRNNRRGRNRSSN